MHIYMRVNNNEKKKWYRTEPAYIVWFEIQVQPVN